MCIYILYLYNSLSIYIYKYIYDCIYIYVCVSLCVLLFLVSGSGNHSSSLVNINHQQVSSILVHCDQLSSGWWLSHPSEKYEFVSWDHDIPKWMESHKIHVPYISIPPTSQWIIIQFHFVDLGVVASGWWITWRPPWRTHVAGIYRHMPQVTTIFWLHKRAMFKWIDHFLEIS